MDVGANPRPRPPSHRYADSGAHRHNRRQSRRTSSYDYQSSSRQSRSSQYDTESGLSPAKLKDLNQQLGWEESRQRPRHSEHRESRHRESSRRDSGYRDSWHGAPGYESRHHRASQDYGDYTRKHGRIRVVSDDFYYRHERPRVTSGQGLLDARPSEKEWDVSRRTQRRDNRRSSGHGERTGRSQQRKKRRKKRWWICGGIVFALIVLIVGVAVGVSVSHHHSSDSSTSSASNLSQISPSSIPPDARGTYLDPFTWLTTTDFNVTYTPVMYGNLSIMGLNSTWNDDVAANPSVPALNKAWKYGKMPIRGVNLGGWLSTEPFIAPSLFSTTYSNLSDASIPGPPYVDEYSLSLALGPDQANKVLESHYDTFVSRSTFQAIRAAGFDHVRIPFPYWAVTTYPGDPYVPNTSWRYLLRGIEYARENGLRVNLDLHAVPGSQNGWNHSGRQGTIGWLNGTDSGQVNGDRTLQIHRQLAAFFAQPRWANVVTLYGLVNEPAMNIISADAVLNWTQAAISILREPQPAGLDPNTVLVVSDGFLALTYWHDALAPQITDPASQRILLDAHQYVIFNTAQLSLNHSAKLSFACDGWHQQTQAAMDPTQGFGTFVCGEWSQADTDCAAWLNQVNRGTKWEGTLNTGNASTSTLTPSCPDGTNCTCAPANADPSTYEPSYGTWLDDFAGAQIRSFEAGWGWFYWTWDVEDGVAGGTQWSWRKAMAAGIVPGSVEGGAAAKGVYSCEDGDMPAWESMGLPENY